MSSQVPVTALPSDMEAFLRGIVRAYLDGQRDESFAEWAATAATLVLERYGCLY